MAQLMTDDPQAHYLHILRSYYQELVVDHLGPRAADKAILVPGAKFILGQIGRLWKRFGEVSILDMGLGFSTIFIGAWMSEQAPDRARYIGVDHDPDWRAFVAGIVKRDGPKTARMTLRTRKEFEAEHADDRFHVILVDHGPSLDQRATDVPWLVQRLGSGGVMLFDDWRPKHEGRIRRAMAKVDGDWKIWCDERVRRFPKDKSIGVVERR